MGALQAKVKGGFLEKLFWHDPYLSECRAKVESINGNEVQLDRTVFFAFSGGQQSDSGTIGGIPVQEARKEGNNISYILESPPTFAPGDEVEVKIDAEKRKRIMRLHSAAHIVWYIFEKKTGVKKLIGSNVTSEKSRIDYEFPESLASILPEVESEVNELIEKGMEIKTYPDPENPERRWWEMGEWKCPCGGTHPKDAREIGKIKLKRKNIGKGKERIEITLS
jgi:Ser-tRNA(Ala) deacylase AlaX